MQRLDINNYLVKTGYSYSYENHEGEFTVDSLAFLDNNKFLLDWFNYDCKQRVGVYMIGDFYIGQSKNLRKRLLDHSKPAVIHYVTQHNKLISEQLKFYFENGLQIPFTILSTKVKLEDYFIKRYRNLGYPLVNKTIGIGPRWEILSNDK